MALRRLSRGRSIGAFTLLEVLISMIVLALIVHIVGQLQHSSWASSRTTANTMAAGHLITQEIERQRMYISLAPDTYWPPHDSTVIDAAPGIGLSWTVTDAYRPSGNPIDSVRQVDYVARWYARGPDSIALTTFLAHDF